MTDWDLEKIVDRELKGLPQPRAPHTLMARVLEAVAQAPQAPWYARPWRAWRLEWQVVSALFVLGVLTGTLVAGQYAWQMLNPEALPGQATAAWLASVIARGGAAARGLDTLWRVIVEPLALVVLVPVLLMFVASVVFGAALSRLAFGGPSET
jgi:ribose/xylose/arabinose/galactoside ABC-type transport system permease subunit